MCIHKSVITIIIVLIVFSTLTWAETATRIPITVNVVKGCNVTDEEINEVVKEAGKLMKKYMISYEVKNIRRDVNGAGTDGKIAANEEHGVVTGSMNEIKNADGTYKGMKVFYGNELRQSNYYGMAYHANNGGHWYSVPVVFMKKRPGTDPNAYKEKGNDLAHELAHSLTLVGKKKVSGTLSGVSDANGHLTHPLDTNNLMYKNNGGTPPYRVERGSDLSPEQIKEIKENAKRFGKNYVVTPSEEYYRRMHPQNVLIFNHLPRVLWVDDPNETYMIDFHDDLAFGYFYAESVTAGLMDMVFHLAGAFPNSYNVNSLLSIELDTDNNSLTGDALGYDKRILVELNGQYPMVDASAQILNFDGSLIDFAPVAMFQQTDALGDSTDPDINLPSELEPFTDTIFVQLSSEILEITADEIPVHLLLENLTTPAIDETAFVFNTQAVNEPNMTLVVNSITPGENIEIVGNNYTPNEPVEIYLDEDLLDVTMADGSGNIDVNLPYPSGYEFGRYFIAARDTMRSISDFSVLTLFHVPGDIDLSHEVTMIDFAYIANDWLIVE